MSYYFFKERNIINILSIEKSTKKYYFYQKMFHDKEFKLCYNQFQRFTMELNMNNSDITKKTKKSNKTRFILAVGFVILLITFVLVFSLFQPEPKPDPAFEKILHQEAAMQVHKAPNEITEEDFAKITAFVYTHHEDEKSYAEFHDIKLLAKCTNLKTVHLAYIGYPYYSIPKWMRILAKLGIYDLSEKCAIDLRPLEKLPNLDSLCLIAVSVNLNGLKKLGGLKELALYEIQISDIDMLKELKELNYLNISYTQVTNFKPLSNLTNLQTIYFDNCLISDLEPIKKLINLKQLYLKSCNNITAEQIEDLQKALPGLEIVR